MLVLTWIIAALIVLMAICAFPWLCQQLMRALIHHWRNAPPGPSAYDPLQEFIQPQIRHVVEVRQQRLKQDQDGAPPQPTKLGD